MRKIIAGFVVVVLLFQMTSCYSVELYEQYYSYLENYMTTAAATEEEIPYAVETSTILEKGKPLSGYYIYDGVYDSDASPLRPSYRQGICRNLKGSPVVVLLFADDEESVWTAEEIVSFTDDNVIPALAFLKREALRWDVSLDFQLESYSAALTGFNLSFSDVISTDPHEAIKENIMDQMAWDLGFFDEWELYSYMQSQYPAQDIVFVVLMNKNGRSYASQLVSKGYNRDVEYCLIYGKDTNAPAQTVAHEILHLFGAEDLYEEATSPEIAALAERYYPNDIMLGLRARWKNRVDAYTAYAIGWTSEVPEVCDFEEWYFD